MSNDYLSALLKEKEAKMREEMPERSDEPEEPHNPLKKTPGLFDKLQVLIRARKYKEDQDKKDQE